MAHALSACLVRKKWEERRRMKRREWERKLEEEKKVNLNFII